MWLCGTNTIEIVTKSMKLYSLTIHLYYIGNVALLDTFISAQKDFTRRSENCIFVTNENKSPKIILHFR